MRFGAFRRKRESVGLSVMELFSHPMQGQCSPILRCCLFVSRTCTVSVDGPFRSPSPNTWDRVGHCSVLKLFLVSAVLVEVLGLRNQGRRKTHQWPVGLRSTESMPVFTILVLLGFAELGSFARPLHPAPSASTSDSCFPGMPFGF